MSQKKSSGTGRTRNFATVVYPESAPDGWKDILNSFFIPAFISPLHDSDINPTGESKKPHYHVMLMYDGVKTIDQVREVVSAIGGVGCEKIASIRGYARYLCHLDNPDKAQYKIEDVIALSGSDYFGVIGTVVDKYKAIGEMIDFCVANNIHYYSELLIYCRNERFDWFRVLCDSGTYVIKEFLKTSAHVARVNDSEGT